MTGWMGAGVVSLSLLAAGCVVGSDTDKAERESEPAAQAPAAAPAAQPVQPDMRLEVDLSARELHVYRGGQRAATHPVAVGSKEWPTPEGEWTIEQVIWNPRWI